MKISEIEQELVNQGKEPNDFIIKVTENRYSITPKWFYETKEIAKQENKPIIKDVDEVATLTTITAMDKDEIAEMLVFALQRIDELEVKVND